MVDVGVNTMIPAEAQTVWDVIGEFDALAKWHPAVSSSEGEDGGQRRRLHLADGSEIVEKLVQKDDGGRTYTYTIEQSGPLPVQNYKSTIAVEDNGQGRSTVTWSGHFEATGDPEEARKAVAHVYQTGLDNLKKLMGG